MPNLNFAELYRQTTSIAPARLVSALLRLDEAGPMTSIPQRCPTEWAQALPSPCSRGRVYQFYLYQINYSPVKQNPSIYEIPFQLRFVIPHLMRNPDI
jgi:hypothetical protein